MINWCLYELIYLITFSSVTLVFVPFLIYALVKRRIVQVEKLLALHFISVVLIGLGYFLSELLIDELDLYRCSENEQIALLAMLFVLASVSLVSLWHWKKQHVVNKLVNRLLAALDIFCWVIVLFIVISDFENFYELSMLLLFIPFQILITIISYPFN